MNEYNPDHVSVIVNFRVGQKVVVFNSNNEILFLKRSNKCARAGGWDFPGGALEEEEAEEGIVRETREETGLEIEDVAPISLITHLRDDPQSSILLIGYKANLKSGEVRLSWEHDQYKWVSVEEALKIDLPEGHRKFLKAAIKNR
ncbi:MAG: NUDIX hydrolase [Candidatus Pacebacteria bacterium]|nr:NUDIX hydrolase [Candidatus Paceibacterota bacterium]